MTARILIVDDSESIRETLGLTLRFKGYEVQEAENGEQALKILQQDVFDLVFCDLAMPGMDGREVIRRLRKQPGLENLGPRSLRRGERDQGRISRSRRHRMYR
ncbi:response regulator [bacterium]|nr:response regulator [bacterium]